MAPSSIVIPPHNPRACRDRRRETSLDVRAPIWSLHSICKSAKGQRARMATRTCQINRYTTRKQVLVCPSSPTRTKHISSTHRRLPNRRSLRKRNRCNKRTCRINDEDLCHQLSPRSVRRPIHRHSPRHKSLTSSLTVFPSPNELQRSLGASLLLLTKAALFLPSIGVSAIHPSLLLSSKNLDAPALLSPRIHLGHRLHLSILPVPAAHPSGHRFRRCMTLLRLRAVTAWPRTRSGHGSKCRFPRSSLMGAPPRPSPRLTTPGTRRAEARLRRALQQMDHTRPESSFPLPRHQPPLCFPPELKDLPIHLHGLILHRLPAPTDRAQPRPRTSTAATQPFLQQATATTSIHPSLHFHPDLWQMAFSHLLQAFTQNGALAIAQQTSTCYLVL